MVTKEEAKKAKKKGLNRTNTMLNYLIKSSGYVLSYELPVEIDF